MSLENRQHFQCKVSLIKYNTKVKQIWLQIHHNVKFSIKLLMSHSNFSVGIIFSSVLLLLLLHNSHKIHDTWAVWDEKNTLVLSWCWAFVMPPRELSLVLFIFVSVIWDLQNPPIYQLETENKIWYRNFCSEIEVQVPLKCSFRCTVGNVHSCENAIIPSNNLRKNGIVAIFQYHFRENPRGSEIENSTFSNKNISFRCRIECLIFRVLQ